MVAGSAVAVMVTVLEQSHIVKSLTLQREET